MRQSKKTNQQTTKRRKSLNMTKNGKNLEKLIRIVEKVYKSNPNTKVHGN